MRWPMPSAMATTATWRRSWAICCCRCCSMPASPARRGASTWSVARGMTPSWCAAIPMSSGGASEGAGAADSAAVKRSWEAIKAQEALTKAKGIEGLEAAGAAQRRRPQPPERSAGGQGAGAAGPGRGDDDLQQGRRRRLRVGRHGRGVAEGARGAGRAQGGRGQR